MNNKKIGLALSGGAAKGLAHIGVLQVLAEHKVPIGFISGCSMGAIVGSAYCAGADLYMLARLVASMDNKSFFDVGIHKKGLIKGEKFEELIRMFTRGKNIEDFDIPFAAVACDLHNGRLKTFRTGPAYQAVRASISIPAMFVPYEIDGRQYVDGGVIERVPVDACKSLGADTVIAVDVGYMGQETESSKSIFEVVAHVLEIMQWEISKERLSGADLTIAPDVANIRPYSNAQTAECVELGRQATLEVLPRILELINNAEFKVQNAELVG